MIKEVYPVERDIHIAVLDVLGLKLFMTLFYPALLPLHAHFCKKPVTFPGPRWNILEFAKSACNLKTNQAKGHFCTACFGLWKLSHIRVKFIVVDVGWHLNRVSV